MAGQDVFGGGPRPPRLVYGPPTNPAFQWVDDTGAKPDDQNVWKMKLNFNLIVIYRGSEEYKFTCNEMRIILICMETGDTTTPFTFPSKDGRTIVCRMEMDESISILIMLRAVTVVSIPIPPRFVAQARAKIKEILTFCSWMGL